MMQNLINVVMTTNSKHINIRKLENLLVGGVHQDSEPEAKFVKKKTFAPSTIGNGHGACSRYWWYALEGTDSFKPHNMRGATALQWGKDSHTRLQELLKKVDILVDEEVAITSVDPPIKGFADALIRFDDKDIVVEIKTMKQELFNLLATAGPPQYHMIQLLLYMHLLEKDHGLLWYENKNNGDWHFVQFTTTVKNEKYVKQVLQWLRDTYAAWQRQPSQLPKRQFNKTSKNCKYCPFTQVCWEERKDNGVINMWEFPVI